jgi:hypothetical protein
VVLRLAVNLGAAADLLVDAGFLAAWDSEDREQVRASLQTALDAWSRPQRVFNRWIDLDRNR